MSKLVVYLAAPVSPTAEQLAKCGDPDLAVGATILRNLKRARRWLRWLVERTEWSIVASWMPYVETLDEERWRARGLADDLAVVERCDAIVLVGGRVSSGMAIERDHAVARGLRVVDLTAFGEEPPTDDAAARALIAVVEMVLEGR